MPHDFHGPRPPRSRQESDESLAPPLRKDAALYCSDLGQEFGSHLLGEINSLPEGFRAFWVVGELPGPDFMEIATAAAQGIWYIGVTLGPAAVRIGATKALESAVERTIGWYIEKNKERLLADGKREVTVRILGPDGRTVSVVKRIED